MPRRRFAAALTEDVRALVGRSPGEVPPIEKLLAFADLMADEQLAFLAAGALLGLGVELETVKRRARVGIAAASSPARRSRLPRWLTAEELRARVEPVQQRSASATCGRRSPKASRSTISMSRRTSASCEEREGRAQGSSRRGRPPSTSWSR